MFDTLVSSFRQMLSTLPDKRTGKNSRYGMEDAALSAFSVFFTQTPSFLAYQWMGDIAYALDTRSGRMPIVEVPFIGMSLEAIKICGMTFEAFLEYLNSPK